MEQPRRGRRRDTRNKDDKGRRHALSGLRIESVVLLRHSVPQTGIRSLELVEDPQNDGNGQEYPEPQRAGITQVKVEKAFRHDTYPFQFLGPARYEQAAPLLNQHAKRCSAFAAPRLA